MLDNLFENIKMSKVILDLNMKYKDLTTEGFKSPKLTQCDCTAPGNTTNNLKETFAFIKNIQESNIEDASPVYIYFKASLQKSQFSTSLYPNSVVSSLAIGYVTDINNNYVTISTEFDCSAKNGQAFIPYSKILYIAFPDLSIHYKEYLQLISNTQPLCYEKSNQYLEMLTSLSHAISINYNSDKKIQLIFTGIRSAQYVVSSFCVNKNLIIVSAIFIIPINSVSGFDLLPPCIVPIAKSKKVEE